MSTALPGAYPSTTRSPENDPHSLPSFDDTDTIVKPSRTVLYLPPLLSSLPQEFADDETIYASSSQTPSTINNDEPDSTLQDTTITPQPPSPTSLNAKLAQLTETRLPHIDQVSLALHRALHQFRPITEEYSSQEYHESFNWDDLELPENMEGEWYCVAFRSRRKANSDDHSLYEADRDAHAEAVSNGGLIMYWYGVPHPITRDNLATCIWQSRAHAVAANSRPYHAKAARLAAASYEMYTLERYTLRKELGTRKLTVDRYNGPTTTHSADSASSAANAGSGCPVSTAAATQGQLSKKEPGAGVDAFVTCPVTGAVLEAH